MRFGQKFGRFVGDEEIGEGGRLAFSDTYSPFT